MSEQPQRHSLVWLAPAGWDALQAANLGAAVGERDAMARWRAADWPLVATRHAVRLAPDQVAVGLALPPHAATGMKPRIAGVIERGGLRRHAPATGLAAVLASVPMHWRAPLAALHLEALEAGLSLRVFGSVAWQSITGMSYLHATSDIDLLCAPACERQLATAIELLDRYAQVLPLDGEVIFPGGAAVAWKEWRNARFAPPDPPRRVLVKRLEGVALIACDALLADLAKP